MTLACSDVALSVDGKVLLRPTDASFEPGRMAAILGPNGVGKSTLLSLLGGQRVPTRGEVRLDGRPLAAFGIEALALRRALMPQESAVAFDFSARDIVALGRHPHRRAPESDEDAIVAAGMGLTDVGALGPRVLATLSGGEKARTHLARGLVQLWAPRPDRATRWLLLDEPTAALDLAHQHATMRLLRRWAGQGVGVIAVLHDLNLARRYADDALVLDGGGGVHQGPVDEVLRPGLIERVWGVPCLPVAGTDGVPQFLFG